MEYYSIINSNEVLKHATTWVNHENMLSERSQSQKICRSKIYTEKTTILYKKSRW